MTKKVAVIGHPISHSLSPKLHNYWIKQYGIDAEYTAIDVKPEELRSKIKEMQAEGYIGCNVTIPHKEAMIDIVDNIDNRAMITGAINTVLFGKDGKKYGYNTDAYGFNKNINDRFSKALVLGAGGASRAVCVALLEKGCDVILTNRTRKNAESLANDIGNIKVIDWDKKEDYLYYIDLLVNTTSLGMKGKKELEINLSNLNKNAVVTDIVYNPLKTNLLKQAEERGNPIVDGLGMLLYQAQGSFAIWFGIEPEVNQELRDYILKNIK